MQTKTLPSKGTNLSREEEISRLHTECPLSQEMTTRSAEARLFGLQISKAEPVAFSNVRECYKTGKKKKEWTLFTEPMY